MKCCEECNKKLGMLEGFKHPTLGKKHLLCSPCFDKVDASVSAWGEFVRVNSFQSQPKASLEISWRDFMPSVSPIISNIKSRVIN